MEKTETWTSGIKGTSCVRSGREDSSIKEGVVMNIKDAIKERHSVRQYTGQPIADDLKGQLNRLIDECNSESGMNIQLICNDPECFNTLLAHYGKFKNADHYIALVGRKDRPDLDETAGYFGQKIVLAAQQMGLNTCWVAGTFGRSKCKAVVGANERIVCVISIGYGVTAGSRHGSKPMDKLCSVPENEMPAWFKNGVLAAMMAPTAINQQKFMISMENGEAVITAGRGPMAKIDLGIVKYNFEAASGHKCR